MVELLIAKGADVNAKNKYGSTPLHRAASGGHKEITEILIAKGADVNAKNHRGMTPLQFAAMKGHKEIAELLIAKGADVNAKENHGRTPLHGAAFHGHKEVVELLITQGADVNAKNEDVETPLDRAIRNNLNISTEIANLLRKHGGKTGEEPQADTTSTTPTSLFEPEQLQENLLGYMHIVLEASDGNIEGVKALLAGGVSVDSRGAFVGTPLCAAAEEGHKEVVELLIANGADVNALSNGGRTPLDLAVLNKHTEIANLLRKHGGKIDKVAQEESTKEHDLLIKALSDKIEAARKAEGK